MDTARKHTFMQHCGFDSRSELVDFISGPGSVVQLDGPRGTKITMWGENHNQPNRCDPCEPRAGCWYLPLLFFYCDGPVVVLMEGAWPRSSLIGGSPQLSMLDYAQEFFTAQNRCRGEVGAVPYRHRHICTTGGRSRDVPSLDDTPRSVAAYTGDLRAAALLPFKWKQLKQKFPDHMYLFRNSNWASDHPALKTSLLRLGSTPEAQWANFKPFAMALALSAFDGLDTDFVKGCVDSATAIHPYMYAHWHARMVAAGYTHVSMNHFAVTLFTPLMDIHMLIEMELQCRLETPPAYIHAIMGSAHVGNMLQILVRRGYELTLNLSRHGLADDSPTCLRLATLTFENVPASAAPGLCGDLPPGHDEGTTDLVAGAHTVQLAPIARWTDAVDPGWADLTVAADLTTDRELLNFAAWNLIPSEPLGRLGVLVPVVLLDAAKDRQWVLQDDDATRAALRMRALGLDEVRLAELVGLGHDILVRTVPDVMRQDHDLVVLLHAAYASMPWQPPAASELDLLMPGTRHMLEAYSDTARRMLAPVLVVQAALAAAFLAGSSNVRLWCEPQSRVALEDVLGLLGIARPPPDPPLEVLSSRSSSDEAPSKKRCVRSSWQDSMRSVLSGWRVWPLR